MSSSPPVTWDGLELNPLTERADAVLPLVEDVTGWYDTPDFDGHDVPLVLADGSVRGPKTQLAREIVITGSVTGPPAGLARFRDELAMRAASRAESGLTITDAAGRAMTASVRCDGQGLKHAFSGPLVFRYQLTLTAADAKLYGPSAQQQLTLGAGGAALTGWEYGQGELVPTAWQYPIHCSMTPSGSSPWSMIVLAFAGGSGEPDDYNNWGLLWWGSANAAAVSSLEIPFALYPLPPGEPALAGDTLAVFIVADSATAITAVTDTVGNSYREIAVVATPDGLCVQHVWIAEDVTPFEEGLRTDWVTVTAAGSIPHVVGEVQLVRAAYSYHRALTATGDGACPSLAVTVPAPNERLAAAVATGTGLMPGNPPEWRDAGMGTSRNWAGYQIVARLINSPYNAALLPQAWARTLACEPLGAPAPWAALALVFDRGTQVDPYNGNGTDSFNQLWATGELDGVTSGTIGPDPGSGGTLVMPAGCPAVAYVALGAPSTYTGPYNSAVTVTDSQGNGWREVQAPVFGWPMPAVNADPDANWLQLRAFTCDPVQTALGADDYLTFDFHGETPPPQVLVVVEVISVSDVSTALPRAKWSLRCAAAAADNSLTPQITLPFDVVKADVLTIWASTSAPWPDQAASADWLYPWSAGSAGVWQVAEGWGPQTSPTGEGRVYPRKYAQTALPNAAVLVNSGNVPAPATAVYSGELTGSRLVDNATGNTIYLGPVADGTYVTVDTSTLTAYAPGGASRASYIGPGSVPLLIPPLGQATWTLYAAGSGSVTLQWASTWA
jgi:hypothetical protein